MIDTVYIKVTQRYLQRQFDDCNIVQTQHIEAPEDLCFEVRSTQQRYFLRVQKEVLDGQASEAEYEVLLENYRVANTMRDLGEFPVVVTNYGCIFGSP